MLLSRWGPRVALAGTAERGVMLIERGNLPSSYLSPNGAGAKNTCSSSPPSPAAPGGHSCPPADAPSTDSLFSFRFISSTHLNHMLFMSTEVSIHRVDHHRHYLNQPCKEKGRKQKDNSTQSPYGSMTWIVEDAPGQVTEVAASDQLVSQVFQLDRLPSGSCCGSRTKTRPLHPKPEPAGHIKHQTLSHPHPEKPTSSSGPDLLIR